MSPAAFAVLLFTFVGSATATLIVEPESLSNLSVTFHKWDALPVTERAAVEQGWTKISRKCSSGKWRGFRYVLNNDYSVILLFDKKGKVAGMQTSISKNLVNSKYGSYSPLVNDENRKTATVYFGTPAKICSRRAKVKYNKLFLQLSDNPRDTYKVPFERRIDATSTDGKPVWMKQKCFDMMGTHYFSFNRNYMYDNAHCTGLHGTFPGFLLYDKRKPVGFGFSFNLKLYGTSPRWEPALPEVLPAIFNKLPKCVEEAAKLGEASTMHVYFKSKADVMKIKC